MSYELKEGVKLAGVSGPPDGAGDSLWLRLGEDQHHCREIVVVMQPGQMGMVPWAKATKNSGMVVMANLALMETVTLLEDNQ